MTTENIFPMRLLFELEAIGVRFSVRDGKLYRSAGSNQMNERQRALVTANKESLIAIITNQCPNAECNAPLRVEETGTYKYLQCPNSPLHFTEVMNKNWGSPMFMETNGVKPPNCKLCSGPNTGEWKYCDKCWLQMIDGEEAA